MLKRVAVPAVPLRVTKTLTKVSSALLHQAQAALYFLLFYLNFQRIENSSCRFLPRSPLKYLMLPRALSVVSLKDEPSSVFEGSLLAGRRGKCPSQGAETGLGAARLCLYEAVCLSVRKAGTGFL